MDLVECIVNDYITYYAYKLDNRIFIYENGHKQIISAENHYLRGKN